MAVSPPNTTRQIKSRFRSLTAQTNSTKKDKSRFFLDNMRICVDKLSLCCILQSNHHTEEAVMNYLANEILEKIASERRDHTDLEKLLNRASDELKSFRNDHPVIAGSMEGAIAVTAISVGFSLLSSVGCADKIPELIGAAFGAGVGGVVGGTITAIGGIGIAMMGTGFAIPATLITAIGTGIGAFSGSVTGWLGIDLATQAPTLLGMLFDNISGAALIAFGCYMLCLAAKDLWRAGGEFLTYLKSMGFSEIPVKVLP